MPTSLKTRVLSQIWWDGSLTPKFLGARYLPMVTVARSQMLLNRQLLLLNIRATSKQVAFFAPVRSGAATKSLVLRSHHHIPCPDRRSPRPTGSDRYWCSLRASFHRYQLPRFCWYLFAPFKSMLCNGSRSNSGHHCRFKDDPVTLSLRP